MSVVETGIQNGDDRACSVVFDVGRIVYARRIYVRVVFGHGKFGLGVCIAVVYAFDAVYLSDFIDVGIIDFHRKGISQSCVRISQFVRYPLSFHCGENFMLFVLQAACIAFARRRRHEVGKVRFRAFILIIVVQVVSAYLDDDASLARQIFGLFGDERLIVLTLLYFVERVSARDVF